VRLLVCASEAPLPPLNGMRAQLRALVERLAHRHEVTVVAPRWPDQDGPAPDGVELVAIAAPPIGLAGRVRDRARSVVRRQPVDVVRLTGPMAAAARELLSRRRFDVAHVGLGELAGIARSLGGLPAVLAPLDAWTLNAASAAAAATGGRRRWLEWQARLVARHVASAYRPFSRVVLVSPEDAAETVRHDPSLVTAVIPNGVDADHFSPDPSIPREHGLMLFTGVLETPANVRAARELATVVLPEVQRRVPDARLALVGRAPTAAVRALASDRVTVVGDAPDLRPWLRRAAVVACPMDTGTGIKNKLLEAMACGIPCVTTPLGSRGLARDDGRALVVAEPGGPYADAVGRVLLDRALADGLGRQARNHVVAHHDWGEVARRYEALYEAAARAGGPDG
jgi:glycosyltransferase involved in cell wall biosynthesis